MNKCMLWLFFKFVNVLGPFWSREKNVKILNESQIISVLESSYIIQYLKPVRLIIVVIIKKSSSFVLKTITNSEKVDFWHFLNIKRPSARLNSESIFLVKSKIELTFNSIFYASTILISFL